MNPHSKQILSILKSEYGTPKTSLSYTNPLELLVSTILSAQCIDARVNLVTNSLFKKYKTAEDYAKANIKIFESEIRSTGFYHNKAKNIIDSAKLLVKNFDGKVPKTMDELTSLPGVARKTANIILTYGFGISAGIAVDTHVFRLSKRLGFSDKNNPDKVEQDLMQLFDKKEWRNINHVLVMHGRAVCIAKKPACSRCLICKYCPSCKKIKGWV